MEDIEFIKRLAGMARGFKVSEYVHEETLDCPGGKWFFLIKIVKDPQFIDVYYPLLLQRAFDFVVQNKLYDLHAYGAKHWEYVLSLEDYKDNQSMFAISEATADMAREEALEWIYIEQKKAEEDYDNF